MADKKKQNDYSAYQEYVNKRNNITPEQYMEYAVNRQGIGQRMAEKRVNNLNNILSNDYLANLGNGQYKTPLQTYQTKRMARDAWLAYDSAAEYLRAVYGRDAASGLNSYARYIKQLNDAAKSEASFYGQFAGQQDYNERYAYPQTVKGKTDAEIEAMIGTIPKTQNMLNRAAAFGKGTGSSGDDAYLKWLTDHFNNKTVTGLDRQIADNQSRAQANRDAQNEVNSRVYTEQITPEINAAKVGVDYWANLKPTDSMIRADRADQVKYNTQQRLYDVYVKAMTGAAMTDDEQRMFDAYVANSPAWQEKQTQLDGNISAQEAQQKRMEDSKYLRQVYNEQLDTAYADYVGILRDNNSPLIAALNKAGAELEAANAALDNFDTRHDEYMAGLPEVENTADMSKVWADIDYADSNQAEYNELVSDRDQKKKAFDAAVAAIENAYSGYIDNAMTGAERSAVDVLDASNILGELQNQQLSLVDDQYAAAMPSVPQAVGQTRVDAFEQERLANLERALRNEDYAKLLAAKEWEENLYSDRNALNAEALDLEYEEVLLKVKREEVAAGSKYNELSKAPDFAALSAYDSSNGDSLYQFINAKGTSQEQGAAPVLGMGEYAGAIDVSAANDEASYQAAGYTFLLPEEVQAYNYIYKKEGREKAQEFLDSFQNIRNLRARSKESEEWKKYAEETGAWSSVVSWGTKFASGMMYPVQLADAVFNPDHSQFSSLYSANYATQAIRGVRGEVWDKKAKEWFGGKDDEYPKFMGENLGSVAYNLFMGLGDMTLAHGAGKMAATLGNINFAKGVTEFVVGSQVGSDVLLQNLHNGVPKDRAIAMAVAASVVESLTERFSIDAIWKDPDNAAKFIAKNIATEASEESVSTFANTIVDLIVNANHAELSKAIAEDGYEKAMNAYLQSVGLDAIMGGLTGAIMSGAKVAGSAALNTAHNASNTIKTGKQINTNQTYKQLHDIAVAMPEGSKARKIAQGKEKLNNRKAGQLYNALMEELDAKSQAGVRKSMVTDIKGRLQELGAQGDTSQVAEAIQKAWMGEKLSARESDLIAQSKLAMQVQHELLDLEEGWTEKAKETASKQRRETLTQMLDVERLASKGYKPAQDDAAAKAISKNASTTYANADQEQGLNTKAYTKEGTTVEIKRIEEQDGKAVYLVEKDGQDVTYAINDLELDSINTENLVEPLKRGKMSVQAANTMMQFYATSGLSAPLYAKGFMVAYNAGVQRIGMAYVNANSYSKALSPEVRKAAFDAGMADTKDEAPSVTKRKGRVTVDKSIDEANLTDGQKASIWAMEKLAKALHIDIEFFASKADATGSYAAYENGSFRDGVMRLDINAGRDKSTDVTEFAILRTASHELTHYIAEASPQLYRELQAFVVDHLLEKGESLQTLMDRKKARENRAMSDEAALAEVIADSCEMMLKDSTAIETLAQENATLFEKIADWLRDFFDKIREAFAGVEAVHAEARALMEADADGVMHYIDGLQALWDKALVDAARNVQGAQENAADSEYKIRPAIKYSPREAFITEEKQAEINAYVDKALTKGQRNEKPVLYIAPVSDRLVSDLSEQGIDVSGRAHYLNDNDVRHIIKSHGIKTQNSKAINRYGTTGEDIKAIPYIVRNYTEVYYTPKEVTGKAADGIVYRLDDVDTVYYVEQVMDGGGLFNKQLIKVPRGESANLVGLDWAIEQKKHPRDLTTADKSGLEVYARSAQGILSDEIISQVESGVNGKKQARDADTISGRDILANARPEDYRQSTAHGFLVDYQKAYQELERLADKLDKYQKAASAGNLDRDEQIKADNRVKLVRDQVLRQENKLHKMESKPEFTKVIAQERETFYNAVNSMTTDELNAKIKQLEAKYKAIETASAKELEDLELALEMNLGKKAAKELRTVNERNEKLKTENKALRNEVNLTGKKIDFAVAEKELAMEMNLGHKREIMRQMYESRLATLKSKNAQKLAAANQRGRERLEKYRERVKDTQSRAALRDRIKHDVKALNRMLLNETDVKHVPEELKGAVAQFLTVFTEDSSVFDQKKLDDLRYAYGKISDRASDENRDMPQLASLYDGDIAVMLDELRDTIGNRRLSELDQLETESVHNIVKHFKHLIQKANNVFVEGRNQQISALGDEIIKAADEQKQYAGKDDPVRTMLTKGMITPSYFFKKMGGSMKKLFDDLKAGESVWGLREAEARKFFNETAKKYNYWDWAEKREGMKPELLKIETSEGKTITLTREQAMSLYATWNRETSDNGQSARHLAEGGFVYEDAMKQDKISKKVTSINTKNPFKITKDDMAKVEAWLTDEQKGYVREMVRYMSEDMAKLGNEVSMQLFGYEKYTEKNYYPYQSSKNWLYTAPGQRTATNDQRLKHTSFTNKTVQFANNPIILSDFTTVWSGHVNHMILYSSMCVPLENLNRVYNYKYSELVPAFNEKGEPEIDKNTGEQKMVARGTQHSVKNSLENAYGRKALEYIDQLMVDMNGGVRVKDDGIMNRLSSVFKKSAVMLSASVVLQQPSAMVRAMALVDPKYFVKGVAMHSSWNELKQYSGLAVIKEMGGFDTGVGESTQNWLVHREINRNSNLDAIGKELVKKDSVLRSEVMGFLPAKADELTWTHIWRAVKAETRDRTDLAVNSEAFLREAARRFDEVISYTQVYDSTLSKSQMMRNKSLNMVTAFMAEPTVTYNLLVDAFSNTGKADSVKRTRAVAAFVGTTLVNALLVSFVYAGRDDDEEKGFWDKYFREFTEKAVLDLTFVNSIPYARDIISLIQGYDVERPDMSVISDVVDNIKNIFDDDLTGEQRAKEIAILVGNITGVPVKNVLRDVNAMLNVWNMRGTLDEAPEYTGRTFLESLTFWSRESASTYYGYIVDEMEKGNTSGANELWEYTAAVYGKTDKAIKSGAKTQLGKRYKAGKIGDAEATDILMDYFEMDADEAYWQLKEWREKEAHKDEDDYSFSRTDDLKEALLSGKMAQIEAAKTELAGVGGYTGKEVVSKAKSAIKSLYVDGQITIDKAMKLLQEQAGEMTKDDLYWTEQEWAYEKANPDGEWNKFMGAHAAIESGKGAKQAAKELLTHGVEKGDAARAIATRWKDTYVSLYKTDRKAALDLHSRILDMYVALGYSRSYQIKYIKDHWFE